MSIPIGLCQCGCGLPTTIPQYNDRSKGWVAGVPLRFVWGHCAKTPEAREKARIRFVSIGVGPKGREVRHQRMKAIRKLSSYKAGATMRAKAALAKIESALRRPSHDALK